jgi:Flp pilus assembly protein TadG
MMKINKALFIAIACIFSFSCFGQENSKVSLAAANANTYASIENQTNEDLVVEAYMVEETVNMKFGKNVTKYKVSKLELLKTHDLGPNNTRTITPIYGKAKVKRIPYVKPVKDTVGAVKPVVSSLVKSK